jgi:uncharacterized repeat protein (TIGR01451 family)
VVVGNGQQLAITKQVAVVGGGPVLAGSTLDYAVIVTNVASVPGQGVVLTDDLPVGLTLVPGSATLNGAATGVTVAGSLITADYSTTYGPLAPGAIAVLRFRAVVGAAVPNGTTITNTGVVTWNTNQTANASVSVQVGFVPGIGVLSGTAWHDADFDDVIDTLPARPLVGWSVELLRNNTVIASVLTDAGGAYQVNGVPPNDTNGDQYLLRFRAPGAGLNTASLGIASSVFTNGPQQISNIIVPSSGANLTGLNLPIDPNGVVYDAGDPRPDFGRDGHDARGGLGGGAARELLRRSRAAEPGDARERLLQVRRELLRPGVSERRCLPARRHRAGRGRSGHLAADPARHGCDDAPVLGAVVPGQRGRCRPGAAGLLRGAGAADRARRRACSRARRARTTTCTSRSTTAAVRAPRSCTTTTSDRSAGRRHRHDHEDHAVADVSRGQLVPYEITVNNTLASDRRSRSSTPSRAASTTWRIGAIEGRRAARSRQH